MTLLIQEVRFATMADEAEVSDADRDRLFEIVRDGSYAEAKKVLSLVRSRHVLATYGSSTKLFFSSRRDAAEAQNCWRSSASEWALT